ncbi:sulfur acquisition oxidoreductase, SfnB family [Arboricoccus pini]|uniref:Dibenzothiophene monooxygenase n=1 Tax=Arboricoccus pini TaxID=1963835 RepID=A0A212S3I0_9PROT|nr:SfnB family sulfur acquisition oxidoreductase [Arboricoccus pini]SNB79656.1 sulfur acquisition oxidoreductase, SfnB family [Arboricoccus pini]
MGAPSTVTFDLHPRAKRISSDEEAIRVARELAEDFAQDAALRDRERRLPAAELDRFSGSGLWAMSVPKAYGGAGVSFATLAKVIAIISAADPSIGQIPQNHLAFVDVLRVFGSEAQKQRWFGRILEGYRLGNAFSEAQSRTVAEFQTRLRPAGENYVLDGEKFYCTGALFAHFHHVGAMDDEGRLNLAVVPRGAPGLTITDDWSGFGQRITASGSVKLEGVPVAADDVVPVWRGVDVPNANGAVSQIIQAAVDAGIARGAIEATIQFVKETSRPWLDSGKATAGEDLFILRDVGQLMIKLHAAEAMLESAGLAIDAILDGPDAGAVANATIRVAEAKILTTELAIEAGDKLHELAGTRSTLARYNLDRYWRNARTHTLHDPVRWKYFHIGNHLLNGVAPPRHAWS